jgi:hypothetical protein
MHKKVTIHPCSFPQGYSFSLESDDLVEKIYQKTICSVPNNAIDVHRKNGMLIISQ